MRKIFILIMLSVCLSIQAQTEETKTVYCLVSIFGGNFYVQFPDKDQRTELLDENDKKLKANNEAHALTYMAERGWKYEGIYKDITFTWYIMSKTIKEDKEIYEGLKTEKATKK